MIVLLVGYVVAAAALYAGKDFPDLGPLSPSAATWPDDPASRQVLATCRAVDESVGASRLVSATLHGQLLHACYTTDAAPGGFPDVVVIDAEGRLVRSPELLKEGGAWPWRAVVASGEQLGYGFAALSAICALGWYYNRAALPGPAPRLSPGRPAGRRRSSARRLRIGLQLGLGLFGLFAFTLLYVAGTVRDSWGVTALLFLCSGFLLGTVGGWFWLMHPDFDRPDGAVASAAAGAADPDGSRLRAFRAGARTRSAASRWVRAIAITLTAGMLIATFGGAATLLSSEQASTAVIVVLVLMYLGATQVIGIIAFLLALPLILGWRSPAPILLLRPFNRPDHSRPLRSLVRREVAGYGHVYSLADVSIKVRWSATTPVLLGQLGLMSYRQRRLRNAADLQRLVERQRQVRRRNVNWVVARSKVFAVRCVDRIWQRAVVEMVRRSDAVLMDVTEVTDNMIWEIEVLLRHGRLGDCLFLAQHGGEVRAASAVSALTGRPVTVFAFDQVGRLATPHEFRSALGAVLFRTATLDRQTAG